MTYITHRGRPNVRGWTTDPDGPSITVTWPDGKKITVTEHQGVRLAERLLKAAQRNADRRSREDL